jgi:hypothetical protein
MTYKISSVKANNSIVTKDPLKDVKWGNEYFCVDDCVRVDIQEPTQADVDRAELLNQKKLAVASLELKNLRKLYDGEDITAVNAERIKLRNEIKQLEGK